MKNLSLLVVLFLQLAFVTLSTAQSKSNDPIQSFEHFWELFHKSYAAFEERGVDWEATYETYRPQVTAKTTDEELFGIFEQMLLPLNDAHVGLSSKRLDKEMNSTQPSRIKEELAGSGKGIRAMTKETLHEHGFKPFKEIGPKFRGTKLFAYTDNGKVGYLRLFRSFSKIYWMKGLGLNGQLNKIMKSFKGLDAIIIDVRFNMGGTDEFSFNLIGHLIEKEILSHYKQTKVDVNKWTDLRSIMIKPAGNHRFLKSVYLVTNDKTVSAADVLALGMSTMPNVTIVGDRTNGSLSDIYNRKLPNGFRLKMSNQRYLSTDKVNYEGLGVPVDIEAHTTLQDVKQKNDLVLIKVLELIEEE